VGGYLEGCWLLIPWQVAERLRCIQSLAAAAAASARGAEEDMERSVKGHPGRQFSKVEGVSYLGSHEGQSHKVCVPGSFTEPISTRMMCWKRQ